MVHIIFNALEMYIFGLLLLYVLITLSSVNSTPYTSDCNEKLLENREFVPDSAFSQSSYEINFKGKYARDSSNEDQAWCPLKKTMTHLREFVSIDLGQLCVIKMVMTRGRNAVGYVSAQSYFIKYKHENESEWKFYRNYSGSKELIGRKDPLNENFISLEPPLIARWLRVFPYQSTSEKICLKLQLYGCINTNHVVEYQMLDGSKYQRGLRSNKFKDITYDGRLVDNNTLIGGIGKLVDRDIEGNSELTPIVDDAKKFVGWDQNQIGKPFVSVIFRFDGARNFSIVAIRVANHFGYNIRVFKSITITFGWNYNGIDILSQSGRQSESIQSDDRMMTNRWIEIDIRGQVGNFVKIDLYFASQWLIISEIAFQSEFVQIKEGLFDNDIENDYPSTVTSRNRINVDREKWETFTALPLTHTLGIICGILGIIILMSSLVLMYLHNKRKRNSPIKERVLQLKFLEDENLFLGNESQFYSSKLSKGTIIPFNITPYKYYTAQKNPNDLSIYSQTLLTPNHKTIKFPTSNGLLKSSPNHNPHGIDSYIYTSLPASDTDSFGTSDHRIPTSHQFIAHNFQNSPLIPHWNNRSFKRPEPLGKVYFNSNVLDDNNSFTFQCHTSHCDPVDIDSMGLIYTNADQSPDYDSFKTHTLNDTDDDTGSLFYPGSNDYNIPCQDIIMGCCGNATMTRSIKGSIPSSNLLIPSFNGTNVDNLVPLGTGQWGDLFIDISLPSDFGLPMNDDTGTINQNYGFCTNENKAVLVKVLDNNAPREIRERFNEEFSLLATVHHDGFSRVLSANFNSNLDRLIITSEYSLHGNLHSYFQNMSCSSKFKFLDSALNMEGHNIFKNYQSTMTIILQLAEALNYLEMNHLIHRDVSCRNCLIFSISEKELKIKLVDSAMGQAQYRSCYLRPRTVLQASPVSTIHSGSVSASLLPLRWSARETITHNKFSAKSDVYAFGITAWEIFNKCRIYPMPEMTEEQIILNALDISSNQIEKSPTVSLLPTCTKEISDFIQLCINPNPRVRPNFHDVCIFIQSKIPKSL